MHCPKFNRLRAKYLLTGKTVLEILNDDVEVDNLMGYLKESGYFNEI